MLKLYSFFKELTQPGLSFRNCFWIFSKYINLFCLAQYGNGNCGHHLSLWFHSWEAKLVVPKRVWPSLGSPQGWVIIFLIALQHRILEDYHNQRCNSSLDPYPFSSHPSHQLHPRLQTRDSSPNRCSAGVREGRWSDGSGMLEVKYGVCCCS